MTLNIHAELKRLGTLKTPQLCEKHWPDAIDVGAIAPKVLVLDGGVV